MSESSDDSHKSSESASSKPISSGNSSDDPHNLRPLFDGMLNGDQAACNEFLGKLLAFVKAILRAWQTDSVERANDLSSQTQEVMVDVVRGLRVQCYKLTNESLNSLRSEEVPETVLAKLKVDPVIDREFKTRESFQAALKKILSEDELKKFQDRIFNHAAVRQFRGRKIEVFIAWIRTITVRHALNSRGYGKHEELSEDFPGSDFKAASIRDLIDLTACLDRLSDEHRRAIQLRFFEGLKWEEAARLEGIKKSAIRIRAKRALERLAQCLWRGLTPESNRSRGHSNATEGFESSETERSNS